MISFYNENFDIYSLVKTKKILLQAGSAGSGECSPVGFQRFNSLGSADSTPVQSKQYFFGSGTVIILILK